MANKTAIACKMKITHAFVLPLEKGEDTLPEQKKEKKRVSYLYRTATTVYPCCVPTLGDSTGAGRTGLTRHKSSKRNLNEHHSVEIGIKKSRPTSGRTAFEVIAKN